MAFDFDFDTQDLLENRKPITGADLGMTGGRTILSGDRIRPLNTQDIINISEQMKPKQIQLAEADPVQVTSGQYDFIVNHLSRIKDNSEREAEEIRIASALSYSRNLGLPFQYTLQNLDQIALEWNGIKYTPTATNLRSITDSFKLGVLRNQRGTLGTMAMNASSPDELSQILGESTQLAQQMQSLEDSVPRPWYIDLLKMGAESLPYMAEPTMEGIEGYATARLGLEAAARMGGMAVSNASLLQNMGQIGLQATRIGGKLNLPLASAMTAYSIYRNFRRGKEINQGNLFLDLLEAGVPADTARPIAGVAGSINQAIEMIGGVDSSWLKAAGIDVDTVASRLLSRMLVRGHLGELGAFAARWAGEAVTEGSEEVFQGIVEGIASDYAYALSGVKNPDADNQESWIKEAAENFAGGFAVSLLLGLPAVAISTHADFSVAKDLRNLAVAVRSKEQYDKLAERIKPEGVSDEDWKVATDKEFERTRKRIISDFNAKVSQEEIDTTLVDREETDEAPLSTENPDSDAVGENQSVDAPYRTSSGALWGQEVEEKHQLPRAFGQSHRYDFGAPGRKAYGSIVYRTDREGNLVISSVKTREGYESVRQEMVQNFIQRFPDMNITWDTQSQTDADISTSIANANPRGSQYGLNYGENQQRAADREIVKSRLDNIFSEDDTINSALAEVVELIGEQEGITGSQWLDKYITDIRRWTAEEQAEADRGLGPKQHRIGSTQFQNLGEIADGVKATIYAGQYANPTTFLHELSHVLRRIGNNGSEFRAIFEEVRNDERFQSFVRNADNIRHKDLSTLFTTEEWTEADDEFFAELGEAYWRYGQAPSSKLQGFFQRIKQAFRNVYKALVGTGKLNQEVRDYYDKLFGFTPRPASSASTQQAASSSQAVSRTENVQGASAITETQSEASPSGRTLDNWRGTDLNNAFDELNVSETVKENLKAINPELHRMAGLVRESTGDVTATDTYHLDPRYSNLSEKDSQKMRDNAERYDKEMARYESKLRKMENTSKRVTYTIGGKTYGEMARISSIGTFTPSQYIDATGASPDLTLSVEADNVHVDNFTRPDPNMLWDGVGELYQTYDEKIASLRNKYSPMVENAGSWAGKPVRDFFRAYKPQITEMLKEYPKVEMDGVLLLEGMAKEDMPFEKELLQARILQGILQERMILLPRYSTRLLSSIFNVSLMQGSLSDGLAALVGGDKYIEFKIAKSGKLFTRLNETARSADIGFIAVDSISNRLLNGVLSPHSQLRLKDGFSAYIADISNGDVYLIEQNKGRHISDPLQVDRDSLSVYVDLISTLKDYMPDTSSVKAFAPIDYSAYQQAKSADELYQTISEDEIRAKKKKLAFERAYDAVIKTADSHTIAGKHFDYEKPSSRSESSHLFRIIAPRGVFTNKETEISADFGRTYVGEIAGHDWSNEAHLASIMSAPEIYENALYVGRFRLKDERVFDYYLSLFNYDNNQYLVRSSVKFDRGVAYYDHKLSNLQKIKDWSLSGFRLSIPGLDSTNPSIIEDTRLQRFLQGDISEETELVSSPFVDISESNQELFQTADITTSEEWRDTDTRLRANSANFDIAGRPLAPNGQLSRLPYREWVTVRTPAFKEWFGDWMNDPENASKAVDINGEPKLVYHGSQSDTPFSAFYESVDGIFFTSNRNVAQTYTDSAELQNPLPLFSGFVNLRNPLSFTTDPDFMDWSELPAFYLNLYNTGDDRSIEIRADENGRPFMNREEAEAYYAAHPELHSYENHDVEIAVRRNTKEWTDYARENGYDGLIINDIYDSTEYIEDETEGLANDYVIFNASNFKSVDNRGTFSSENPNILYQLSPEYVRENMDYPTRMPSDEDFLSAVENTSGASIAEDGIIIDLERWQKPEQDGSASVRTGVFYLPRGASQTRYYHGTGTGFYGGEVRFTGETLIKAPLAVKGATGGRVPLKAYEILKGKEAAKKLEEDCESIMRPYQRSARANRAMDVYYEYLPDADDDYMDFTTLEINSRDGNQIRYAVQENIIAHAVREAGYDAVVGYNRGKLTEIFDVREGNYPSELDSNPWAVYTPATGLYQTAEENLVSAITEIGNGAESAMIRNARADLSQYGGSNDVEILWGDEKKGLYHIGYRRGADVVANVLLAIIRGNILRYSPAKRTVNIGWNGYQAVLSLDMNGADRTWLLTGWKDNAPDAISEVSTQSDATHDRPTFSRSDMGAGLVNILESERFSGNTQLYQTIDDDWIVEEIQDKITEDGSISRNSMDYFDSKSIEDVISDLSRLASQYTDYDEYREAAEWGYFVDDDNIIRKAWNIAKNPDGDGTGTSEAPQKTLEKPDTSAHTEEQKDREFSEIISTDEGLDEWIGAIRRAADSASTPEERAIYETLNITNLVAPIVRNLIYPSARWVGVQQGGYTGAALNTGKHSKAIASAKGVLKASPAFYRDLYAKATGNDFWTSAYGDSIPEELMSLPQNEIDNLSISERRRVAEDIRDENLRNAILSGNEVYGKDGVSESLRRILEKNDEAIRKGQEDLASVRAEYRRLRNLYTTQSMEKNELWKKVVSLDEEIERAEERIQSISRRIAGYSRNDFGENGSSPAQKGIDLQSKLSTQISQLIAQQNSYLKELRKESVADAVSETRDAERARANERVARARERGEEARKDQYQRDLERMREIRKDRDRKLQELREHYREKETLRRVEDRKKKLMESIMRKPGSGIDIEYSRKITAIQALIDDKNREYLRIDGETWDIDLLKRMFRGEVERDPAVFSALTEAQLDRLSKKSMDEFTLNELSDLKASIDQLREEGLTAWKLRRSAERKAIYQAREKALAAVMANKNFKTAPLPGSEEDRKRDRRIRARLRDIYRDLINMDRKAQLLDGGTKGFIYDLLMRQAREHRAEEQRMIAERMKPVMDYIQTNKVDSSRFYEYHDVTMGDRHDRYRFTDLVYIYLSKNNIRNSDAVAFGNFVTQQEKYEISQQVESEMPGAGTQAEKDRSAEVNKRIRTLGESRYNEVIRQAETIIKADENRDLFEVVRLIEADFNSDLFQRMVDAMREIYNIAVEKEDYYLPINRTDYVGSEPGETIKQDLLNLIPGNASVERGFTNARQDISPLEQKPINTDFFGVWQNSVQAQEHALANMAYVRLLKGVFRNHGSETLRDAIRGTFGENMLDYIEDYISQVANPKSFTKVDKGGNRIIRFIRGSLYSSYLGWRPRSIITQLITSPWPVLSEVNPAELLQASFTVMSHPVEMWKEIERLSPMMANRAPTQMIEWIREEASRSDLPKARRAYMKFQDAGMQGLTWVDRYAVGAGWWAVYQKERNRLINSDENLTEADLEKRAAAKADEVVYETQPQSDITELSPLFQNRSEARQLITQFQASLNVIFQNITFDIPQAFRQHQYAKGIGMITGYAIAGALLYAIQDGLFGDDDEDDEDKPGAIRRLIYAITTQFTAGVPFVSDYVDNLLQQIITGESDGIFSSPSFPAFDRALRGLTNISKGEFAKGGEQFFQGIMLFTGAPYSLARDLGKITGIEGLSDIPDVLSGEQKLEFHPEVLIGREPEE